MINKSFNNFDQLVDYHIKIKSEYEFICIEYKKFKQTLPIIDTLSFLDLIDYVKRNYRMIEFFVMHCDDKIFDIFTLKAKVESIMFTTKPTKIQFLDNYIIDNVSYYGIIMFHKGKREYFQNDTKRIIKTNDFIISHRYVNKDYFLILFNMKDEKKHRSFITKAKLISE